MGQGIVRVDGGGDADADREQGWRVPEFGGLAVGEIVLSRRELRLHAGPNGLALTASAELRTPTGMFAVSVPSGAHAPRVAELLDQVFTDVEVSAAGVLRISFAPGWHLTVPPANDHPPGWLVRTQRHGSLTPRAGTVHLTPPDPRPAEG